MVSAVGNPLHDNLWTIRELARYLRYGEKTVANMVSAQPDRLPPRVRALGHPRWDPQVVQDWVREQSRPVKRKGRLRGTPAT